MAVFTCPNCGAEIAISDPDAAITCGTCHLRATTGAGGIDAAALDGLLHNVQTLLVSLPDGHFRQIAAAYSPRAGRGPEDAIPFTASTARQVCRHLRAHGVACLHARVHANGADTHWLAFATGERGLQRAVRQARRLTARQRARLFLVDDTDA